MTQKEVLERFCVLSDRVAVKIYKNTEPADCFCGAKPLTADFRFSEEVISYIENLVNVAVDEHVRQEEEAAKPKESDAEIKARVAREYIEYYSGQIEKGHVDEFVVDAWRKSIAFAQSQLDEALVEMQAT